MKNSICEEQWMEDIQRQLDTDFKANIIVNFSSAIFVFCIVNLDSENENKSETNA